MVGAESDPTYTATFFLNEQQQCQKMMCIFAAPFIPEFSGLIQRHIVESVFM